ARLFNASPDALIICRQAEGGILEANEGFERLLGYSRAEAIGRSLVDLSLYANPADQQRIATELAAQGFVRDLELDIWTKDGDLGQVSLTAEPIASHGQSCWLIILRDITARK